VIPELVRGKVCVIGHRRTYPEASIDKLCPLLSRDRYLITRNEWPNI